MLNPLKWNAAIRLLVAALVGAVLGIAVRYSVQLEWFNVFGALIGAVVAGGVFYCYRAFSNNNLS